MKSLPRCAVALSLFLAACSEEKVSFYTVAKETATPSPLVQTTGGTDEKEVTWTVPEGWQEQPATSMQQGRIVVVKADGTKADISISGFPGDVGGDLANVNRWRGQINLPPIDEAALQSALRKMEVHGEPASLVEIDEKADGSGRKIIAVILHRADKTWFFKIMGDAPLVSAQKETFLNFLKTIHIGAASSTQATQPPLPPMQSMAGQVAPAPATVKPEWKIPAGWQEQPVTAMRVGSFLVTENDSKADTSVVALAGAAGGRLANVNRWRGQLSLPPLTDESLAAQGVEIKAGNDSGVVIDMVGAAPMAGAKSPQRILGAIIERGGTTWFVKMTGDDPLVKKQKPAFLDFVKSLRLPDHG